MAMTDDQFDDWMRRVNADLVDILHTYVDTEGNRARLKRRQALKEQQAGLRGGLEDGSHDQDPPHDPGE